MNKARRQYFIDKAFQTDFILKFCGVVIVSAFVIGIAVLLLSQNSTTVAIENTQVVVKNTSDFIFPIISNVLILVSFFSAFAIATICLFVSHKISGPLFRIQREIEALAEGDLKRNFNLRSKDQLQDLAKSLEKMTKALKEDRKDLKEKLGKLKEFLKERDFSIKPEDEHGLMELLNDLESGMGRFKE